MEIANTKSAMPATLSPLPQPVPQSDATHLAANVHLSAIDNRDSNGEEKNGGKYYTASQCSEEEAPQRFSHLASTVPDSQALQQIATGTTFQTLLPLPKNPSRSINFLRDTMHSQSSPHDTQELPPSYYEKFIIAQKSLRTNGLREVGGLESAEEAATQFTARTGEPGHVDLGLADGEKEQVETPHREPDLNSEPIDFSPTQATQNRLSQFPESQRFKTPATHGKKRKHFDEEIRSPALPRNPLARGRLSNPPAPALGLSQAFAATQAGSSPIMARRLSEPASDRPSPQIEIQTRPVTASLSSPLRPGLDLRKIIIEPQSCYKPVKQSQAERDRIKVLRKESSDPVTEYEPSDDDDDDFEEQPSIVRRKNRQKERAEQVRERFEKFSSSVRQRFSGSMADDLATTNGAHQRFPVTNTNEPTANRLQWKNQDSSCPAKSIDNSEHVTDRRCTARVVVRGSSQRPMEDDDTDKENANTRALQVPETIARLDHSLSTQALPDESPSLGRSHASRTSDSIHDLERAGDTPKPTFMRSQSPIVAVVNSQPDQLVPRKVTTTQLSQPTQGPSSGAHVSSSAAPPTQSASSLQHRNASIEEFTGWQNKPALPQSRGESHVHLLNTPSVQHPTTISEMGDNYPEQYITRSKRGTLDSCALMDEMDRQSDQSKPSSKYETANTHISDGSLTGQPSKMFLTSLSGKPRKRLGDIATAHSPKRKKRNEGADQGTKVLDDSEFAAAIEDVAESSSASAPQPDSNRRRSNSRCHGLSPDTSENSRPPSSPATSVIHPVTQIRNETPTLRTQGTRAQSRRRENSIWDVEVSPPKSAPVRATMKIVQGPETTRGSARRSGLRNNGRRKHTTGTQMGSNNQDTEFETNLSTTTRLHHDAEKSQEAGPISSEVAAPTHVFAGFNGNPRGYYPAKCIGSTGSAMDKTLRYQIRWDEASQDEVDEHGIRWLDLRVGDQVKVNLPGWRRIRYVVRGLQDRVESPQGQMTDIYGYQTVLLTPKVRKSLPADICTEKVTGAPISAIYLDANLWAQMRERFPNFDPMLCPAAVASPHSPSRSCMLGPWDRPSAPNTPRSRTRRKPNLPAQSVSEYSASPRLLPLSGLFWNMAFAISHPDDSRKFSLSKLVSENGGKVLENGFQEMFEQNLDLTPTSTRATFANEVAMKTRFLNLGFVALIADRHSRKPKYLQALALNLPCLSTRWVEACMEAKKAVDWVPYLLAAGESSALDNAVRSRMLPPIDPDIARLKDTIALRPHLLSNDAVIVVTGTGKAGEGREPYIFLTKMAGAGRVEQCPSLEKAKALLRRSSETDFQWMFVDEKSLSKAKAALSRIGKGLKDKEGKERRIKVVGNDFLCQSLILGRLLESFGKSESRL